MKDKFALNLVSFEMKFPCFKCMIVNLVKQMLLMDCKKSSTNHARKGAASESGKYTADLKIRCYWCVFFDVVPTNIKFILKLFQMTSS